MSTRGLKPSPYRVFLHECGRYPGKRHDVPAHHRAEEAVEAYVAAGGLEDARAPLFQSVDRSGRLSGRPLGRRAVLAMINHLSCVLLAALDATAHDPTPRVHQYRAGAAAGPCRRRAARAAPPRSPRAGGCSERTGAGTLPPDRRALRLPADRHRRGERSTHPLHRARLAASRPRRRSRGDAARTRGAPLFEYWGHEACWLPLSLYPCFAWRRKQYRVHPWWGDVLREHRRLARSIVKRIECEGALRSRDLEGRSGAGGWDLKLSRRVAESLWLVGRLAIRERRSFQRSFDLVERVIPTEVRSRRVSNASAFDTLLLRALAGHGWASTGTVAATWRLVKCRDRIHASLKRLQENGRILPCALRTAGRALPGWIRIEDLERLPELERLRPRRDRGVLLSPFDPLLWDRARVQALFGFEQRIEIYKPASRRRYGYYCLLGARWRAPDRTRGSEGAAGGRQAGRARHPLRENRARPPGPPRPWPRARTILRLGRPLTARSLSGRGVLILQLCPHGLPQRPGGGGLAPPHPRHEEESRDHGVEADPARATDQTARRPARTPVRLLCRAPLTTSPLADRPGGPPHPRLVGDGADAPSAPDRRPPRLQPRPSRSLGHPRRRGSAVR